MQRWYRGWIRKLEWQWVSWLNWLWLGLEDSGLNSDNNRCSLLPLCETYIRWNVHIFVLFNCFLERYCTLWFCVIKGNQFSPFLPRSPALPATVILSRLLSNATSRFERLQSWELVCFSTPCQNAGIKPRRSLRQTYLFFHQNGTQQSFGRSNFPVSYWRFC